MTTGSFWNVDNPLKPWGPLDPDGMLDIPYDWATWLAGISSTYASHTFVAEVPLEVVSSSQAAGVILARIRVIPAQIANAVVGAKYGVTCHIISGDGQKEDQTLFFKIRQK
jgi:hypothetical protein